MITSINDNQNNDESENNIKKTAKARHRVCRAFGRIVRARKDWRF